MRRLLYAAYFLEVGLLLVVLPWTVFWDRNYLFDLVPAHPPVDSEQLRARRRSRASAC